MNAVSGDGLVQMNFTNLGTGDTDIEKVGIPWGVLLMNFSYEPPEHTTDHFQILG